jgi:hypothetical protein
MFTLAAVEGHHEEHEGLEDEPIATPVGPDTLDQLATSH